MSEIKMGNPVIGYVGPNKIRRSRHKVFGYYQEHFDGSYWVNMFADLSGKCVPCWTVEPLHIMPPLPDGVEIGDEVEFSNQGWDPEIAGCVGTLAAVTSDGRFLEDDDELWDHCRPIKKKEKTVKKARHIVDRLVRDGYEPNKDGDWCRSMDTAFAAEMFYYCGKQPGGGFLWKPEWLEEI